MKKPTLLFWIGIFILFLMGISYFISFPVDSGANYVVEDRLLGLLVFHNGFVLILYIAIALFLMLVGTFLKIRII